MIVLAHPTGNENVRQVGQALAEANLLERFYTTLAWRSTSSLHRLLPERLVLLLKRRSYPASVTARTSTSPTREVMRLLGGERFLSIDAVSQALDRRVSRKLHDSFPDVGGVYAYEDCALEIFRVAGGRGIQCIYDLPIGYWKVAQRIFAEEAEREPEWASTLTGTRDRKEKLERKEAELRLADRIIVASNFTKQTLAETGSQLKVDVIPYGAPAVTVDEIKPAASRLRVLFAGGLGQRKGLSYFLRALNLLGTAGVEVTLIGRRVSDDCSPLNDAVAKYRWLPTVAHDQMLREMKAHDVLVFPSLFEGFGLVINEAMSQGTPVITTAHTAGPDLIEDGVDGYVVPIRDSEAIAGRLELLVRNLELRQTMQRAASAKAAARSWKCYRGDIVALAREVLQEAEK